MEFWLYFSLMFALGMQVIIEQAAKEAWTSPKQGRNANPQMPDLVVYFSETPSTLPDSFVSRHTHPGNVGMVEQAASTPSRYQRE
jgi:hypothetical protein